MCAEPMHTTACHTCSESIIELKINRLHASTTQCAGLPGSSIPLLIFSEKNPPTRQPAMAANNTLSSLQTIRLLI